MPGGSIVVIQTRWHQDDLSGWLIREHGHEGWDILNFPAIAEDEDILGRQPGQALWPESYPVDALEKIKLAVGSRDWLALYQQRPAAPGGNLFKGYNWRRYNIEVDNPSVLLQALKCNKVIQGWDTSFGENASSDYSVCVTIGITKNAYYVLDVFRDRIEFPELVRFMPIHRARWRADKIAIEGKANGQSAIQVLRRDTRCPIVVAKANKNKVARANAVTPTHEAGLISIPENAAWLSDFETEMTDFPNSTNDDQADAFVHAMILAISMPADSDDSPPENIAVVNHW